MQPSKICTVTDILCIRRMRLGRLVSEIRKLTRANGIFGPLILIAMQGDRLLKGLNA